jgi:hypothetical protein
MLCRCLVHRGVHTCAMTQQFARILDRYMSRCSGVINTSMIQPDVVFCDCDNGRDLLWMWSVPHAFHSLSYRGGFEPAGAVARAATYKMAPYKEVLLRQPPRLLIQPFYLESFKVLQGSWRASTRLLRLVSQASVAKEDLARYSTHR